MKVEGNFEAALMQLITDIRDNAYCRKHKSNWAILSDWDKTRGTDWFTSTRKSEEKENE